MKQVFETNSVLRRVICALLVAIMVFGMIPLAAPKAAAIGSGDKIYLKPNGNWKQGGAWFAAYFFISQGNSQNAKWVRMDPVSGADGIYVCEIPSGANYGWVDFVRMNKDKTALEWASKWDQTLDLAFSASGNLFTINEGE